ncbi:MAG: hypothetical protein AAF511_05920 [Pseudomonadota bacterium]
MAISPPPHDRDLLPGSDGVIFRQRAQSADLVHLFCAHQGDLRKRLGSSLEKVVEGGMFWVSWPKKSSRFFIDLTEDDLRTELCPWALST